MSPTCTTRITLPDDPEEIRALLRRRMRERDCVNNPHMTPEEDRAPETIRAGKRPQRADTAQTARKQRPYRVIRLTAKEAQDIEEGRLTSEEVKRINPDRDDDIPMVRSSAKAKPLQETGQAGELGQTRSQPKTGPDTRTGRVRVTGPEMTPAADETEREARPAQDEDQAGRRQEEQGHDEGHSSSMHKTSPDTKSGRVHEKGPEETPAGAGTDREASQAQEEDQASRQVGQGHDEGQTCSQHKMGPDTRTGQVHGIGPEEARVHETGPDETPTGDGDETAAQQQIESTQRLKRESVVSSRTERQQSFENHAAVHQVVAAGRVRGHSPVRDSREDHVAGVQVGTAGQHGAARSHAATRDTGQGSGKQTTGGTKPQRRPDETPTQDKPRHEVGPGPRERT